MTAKDYTDSQGFFLSIKNCKIAKFVDDYYPTHEITGTF